MARQQARKGFNVSAVLALIAGGVIAAGIYGWIQAGIALQQSRNNTLSAEITKLDEEIKEVATLEQEIAALKARQEAVENLQADRNLPVHLMNEAVRQLPPGIYLKGIKQENNSVLISGMAQSNERISELLRNLSRNSEWVTSPDLVEIAATNVALNPRDQRRVYQFDMRVQLQRASDVASAASAAQAVAPKGSGT
jgi:type IV pilus assembly protein PilN